MKKFIVTLSLAAVAALLATDTASAASYRSYLAHHPGIAAKPALRNSPHVRRLMHQERSRPVATESTESNGLIEYGSAFTAPVVTVGSAPVLSTRRTTSYRHSAVIKPGNRRHWMR